MKVCRLPHRPSQVMRLREELGLTGQACLSFDVACVEFDERFQLELDATKEVELSEDELRSRDKAKPTKTVAANSHAQIMHFLALPVTDDDETIDQNVMTAAADWFRLHGLGE